MSRVILSAMFWLAMVAIVAAPITAGASSYGAPGIPALDGRYLLKSGAPEVRVYRYGTTSMRFLQEAEDNYQIRLNAKSGTSKEDESKYSIAFVMNVSNGFPRTRIYTMDPAGTYWRVIWEAASNSINSYVGNVRINAGSSTENTHIWLNDEKGNAKALLYWDRSGNNVELRKYNNAGNSVSRLTLFDNKLEFKGAPVWHAGNDGASSGLDADKIDGLDIADAPVGGAAFVRISEREELLGYDQNPAPALTFGSGGANTGTITPPTGVRAVRLRIETVITAAGAATSHSIRAYLTDSTYTNFYRLIAQASYKELLSSSIAAGNELLHRVEQVVVPVGPDGAVHLRQGDDISNNSLMKIFVDGYVR